MADLDYIEISKSYDGEEKMLFVSPIRQSFCIENALSIAIETAQEVKE